MHERFSLPVPNGWFAVAWSNELAPGEVKKLRYFARDLVAFRTESGQAHVLDAYCPHLGAHMGVGGKVVGESIQCPFHAWRWDGQGSCVEIPYAKRIPPAAKIHAWPVVERNGMVMVWYHDQNQPPFFEVPVIPEIGHPDWTEPRQWEITCNTHLQEMAENNCDSAHFKFVHENTEVPASEIAYDGLTMLMRSRGEKLLDGGEFHYGLVREAYGLGLVTVRVLVTEDQGLLLWTSTSPIDQDHTQSRWLLTVNKSLGDAAGEDLMAGIIAGVAQDLPIWEHKIHRAKPLLCDGDEFLGEFRRWAANFYSQPAAHD